MKKIAIIGFGGAGYNAAKAVRAYDTDADIHVYSDTGIGPYNPMLTTYYVKGAIDYAALFPFGSLDEIVERLSVRVHRETCVVGMDAKRKILRLSDGSSAQYDRILISTGASAFIPPITGIDLPGVFKMRTARDAVQLKAVLDRNEIHTGLVIGASWVGIKVIEDFYARGIQSTLVDGAGWIFPTATFQETADRIHADLEKKGIGLSFHQMLSRIEREPDGRLTAVMQSGSRFTADVIAVCIGIRPNVGFAKEAGIAVNRGILVDDQMRTNVPDIYAAGDCCEAREIQSGEHKNIGVWMNAQRQGAVAGANMAGVPEKFGSNILLNLAHYMDFDFVSIGDVSACRPEDEVYEYEDERYYIRAVKNGGTLQCVNMIGTAESNGVMKHALIRSFETGVTALDIKSACFMREKGVPDSFIEFLGGISVD